MSRALACACECVCVCACVHARRRALQEPRNARLGIGGRGGAHSRRNGENHEPDPKPHRPRLRREVRRPTLKTPPVGHAPPQPERTERRPVTSCARAGVQIEAEYHCVKRTPSAAMRSRRGVASVGWPYAPRSPYPRSSASKTSTFGRADAPPSSKSAARPSGSARPAAEPAMVSRKRVIRPIRGGRIMMTTNLRRKYRTPVLRGEPHALSFEGSRI